MISCRWVLLIVAVGLVACSEGTSQESAQQSVTSEEQRTDSSGSFRLDLDAAFVVGAVFNQAGEPVAGILARAEQKGEQVLVTINPEREQGLTQTCLEFSVAGKTRPVPIEVGPVILIPSNDSSVETTCGV